MKSAGKSVCGGWIHHEHSVSGVCLINNECVCKLQYMYVCMCYCKQ